MDDLLKLGKWVFLALISLLFILTAMRYSGHFYSYFLFSILLNGFLFFGFRKNRIFFEAFLAIFFWLGFWLKFSIRIAFLNGAFREAIGNFSSSPEAFDFVLNVTSVAVLAFLIAGFLRERFFSFEKIRPVKLQKLSEFYRHHRKFILIAFTVFFLLIGLSNFYFGIYQRGCLPRTHIEGLSGIYTWLLLFGLSSVSAILLAFELEIKTHPYALLFMGLFETFVSSLSMLSRGMIINAASFLYGLNEEAKKRNILLGLRFKLIGVVIFVVLFAGTIVLVNTLRFSRGFGDLSAASSVKAIAIDRCVGIEGMMAVTSYPRRGWDLMKTAMQEKYSDSGTSFYDLNIITSPYLNDDLAKNHFISLPGIIAFLFYSDSIGFLVFAIFVLYFLGALLEMLAYKFGGGNLIFCSLIGQVVAYRYANFGYVPAHTYLLIGAIIANIAIFYFADKILGKLKPSK